MKKFLSIALALVLTLALAVTCFAEVITIDNDEVTKATATVTATYVDPQFSADVFGVDVEFGSMEFTYTDAKQGTWNPENHTYTGAADAAWSCVANANKVTVTNHSNVAITATVKYEAAEDVTVTGKFGENATTSFDLAAGELNNAEGAATNTVYLTLDGAIADDNDNIGTVTVTIAKQQEA